MIKITQTIIVFLVFCSASTAYAGCSETSDSSIANKIASGHAWGKHSHEYVAGKVIANLAMPTSPKVTTAGEFETHILSVMSSATNKSLGNKRKAYWGSSEVQGVSQLDY